MLLPIHLDIVPHAVRVECAENAERAIEIKTTLQSDKHHSAACLCTFKVGKYIQRGLLV